MSTRSGKRLHTSPEVKLKEKEVKTERKTRSQKQKENCIDDGVSAKKHYVLRYPSEEEGSSNTASQIGFRTRKSQRTTLKEVTNNDIDIPKHNKATRRKKNVDIDSLPNSSQKPSKKSKKKKSAKSIVLGHDTKSARETGKKVVKKKISSGSVVIEDLNDQNLQNKSINKNDISVDSFHSAAGSEVCSPEVELGNELNLNSSSINEHSPIKEYVELTSACKQAAQKGIKKKKRQVKSTLYKDKQLKKKIMDTKILEKEDSCNVEENCHNGSLKVLFDNNRNSRSSFKNSTFADISTDNIPKRLSLIDEKNNSTENSDKLQKYDENPQKIHKLGEKQFENSLEKQSTLNNQDQTINTSLNTTYEMQSIHINTTYDKKANNISVDNEKSINNITPIHNSTRKESSSSLNTSIRKSLHVNEPSNIVHNTINVTFEKEDEDCTINKLHQSNRIHKSSDNDIDTDNKLDTTFEKESPKLNSTFDKAEDFSKSSLLTSDSSVINDKSISRISITSDESNADCIINTTPVIVESSLDEAQISNQSPKIDREEPVISPPSNCVVAKLTPTTPLQREGTFTKDSPTDLTSPNRLSTSPGRTPFPSSKRSSKKAVLNMTQSVEKIPKPSFAELPHTTKVMFCSPINTPMITNQVKGKVIKSSMKGSNKSFVFNDQEPRLGSVRKRSYTESECKANDIKRQRLDVDSTNSVSRYRTSSASGKIQNTPTKLTPSKGKGETSRVNRKKLPNFAALHQKQFDKMESLDECQERKARRAQMLAAGSSIAARDKDSKADTKPSEKSNSLLSMNPGYTRFGFKMKSDVNPFSNGLNSTNDSKMSLTTTSAFANSTLSISSLKSKELPNKLKRHTALPSLAGSTARKEMAKQTIMREKSFAEKRNASRNANRTIIKGVRTNRRFELQMQMRNLKD